MAKLKLNKKLIDKSVKIISAGNYVATTCKAIGIDVSTWYKWLQKGENAPRSSIYRQFFDAIKKAEATAEIRNLYIIQNAARTTWQAAAWYLERKYPERWAKHDTVALDDTTKATIQGQITSLADLINHPQNRDKDIINE